MTRGIWVEYNTDGSINSGVSGESEQPKPVSAPRIQKWFPEGTDINGKKIDINTGELIEDLSVS